MLEKLAALAAGRRKLVLVLTLLFCVVGGALGGGVNDKLSAGGYEVPDSASSAAQKALSKEFRAGSPNLVILVETPDGVDDPGTTRAGLELTRALADEPGVSQALSYWTQDRAPLLHSEKGDSALVMAHLTGDEDEVAEHLKKLLPHYQDGYQGLDLKFGGLAEANRELTEQTQKDLALAEAVVLPLTLILLVFVFRGVIAALLPLALGVVAVMGALAVLRVLVVFTDVSVFAMNISTALGLGLGIDYALFVVSRFREELRKGATVEQAVGITLRTAGRTVLFSALTVGLSLSALLIFPMYFLRSFAYAGIAVVAFAVVAALVVLPALLAVLGHRVNKWSFGRHREKPADTGFWHRLSLLVMRRPLPLATGVVVLMALLLTPFLGVRFGLSDERALPQHAQAHEVGTRIAEDYPARAMSPLLVVADGTGDPRSRTTDIAEYSQRLSELPDVARVDGLAGSYTDGQRVAEPGRLYEQFAGENGTWLMVVPEVDPYTDEGQDLVTEVREMSAPFPVQVGGTAASFKDTMASLGDRLPYGLLIIAASIFVLLFLLSGSVLMPVKALVLNLFSLTATFGSMVWVFQDGHLKWLVGDFTTTGMTVATNPIMMFCVAFGLSMDYEVFLLSRIKEEYDRTGDNRLSVARGLERTGGIVTAAALLMALVFLSFLLSGITHMKMLGFGLALAVLMDATLVRGILVPAFMRMAGRFNWWAPAPLARLHRRIGLRDGDDDPAPAAGPAAPAEAAPAASAAPGPSDPSAGERSPAKVGR
ncbi:MMPL family transporter [Streptomyces sp. NPDC052077]|uniref:MMPL family transporter n=1 Tax=Streptomyces sp. NPDC052077 TaxID=3154757 RepID=UPI0034432869